VTRPSGLNGPFSVFVRVAGVDLDHCGVALPLEITHGRSATDSQPDAPVCTFTYLGDTPPGVVGDVVEVEVAGAADGEWADPDVLWTDVNVSWQGIVGRSLRFTGHITSLRAIEVNGEIEAWSAVAIGPLARLGRVPVDLSRPEETDVDRVAAIAADAGVTVQVVGTPGPTLVADNINRDALGALHEVAASSGALVWQQRDGTITYGTMYRHDEMPQWRIACPMVLDGVEWTRDSATVVNHITVIYGVEQNPPAQAMNEQQETFRDDPSIAEWGYRHLDLQTLCADLSDATLLATAVLARRAQPRWVMPGVVVLRDNATDAEWVPVAQLDFGHTALIDVTEAPAPTPGLMTPWTVEGWVELWEPSGRRIQLALSEHRLGAPRTWDDARQDTWEFWATNHSWLTALVEV
jgi:hypothetical protein